MSCAVIFLLPVDIESVPNFCVCVFADKLHVFCVWRQQAQYRRCLKVTPPVPCPEPWFLMSEDFLLSMSVLRRHRGSARSFATVVTFLISLVEGHLLDRLHLHVVNKSTRAKRAFAL
jgi:hypothetical protein